MHFRGGTGRPEVIPGESLWIPVTPDAICAGSTVRLLDLRVGCLEGRSYTCLHTCAHMHAHTQLETE